MECVVYQIGPNDLPIFNKTENETAFIIGECGQNILAVTAPKRVILPLFEISQLTFQGVKSALIDRVQSLRDTVKDMGSPRNNYQMIVVVGQTPIILTKIPHPTHIPGGPFNTCIGMGAIPREKTESGLSNSDPLTNTDYLYKLWQHEGLCPECGESGRLDPCGGAVCRLHGFYQMTIVPKPDPSNFIAPSKGPQIERFSFEAPFSLSPTVPWTAEDYAKFLYGKHLSPMKESP